MLRFKKIIDEKYGKNIEVPSEEQFYELHKAICLGEMQVQKEGAITLLACTTCPAHIRKTLPGRDVFSGQEMPASFHATLPENPLKEHALLEQAQCLKK
jgi:hypothetical protein